MIFLTDSGITISGDQIYVDPALRCDPKEWNWDQLAKLHMLIRNKLFFDAKVPGRIKACKAVYLENDDNYLDDDCTRLIIQNKLVDKYDR